MQGRAAGCPCRAGQQAALAGQGGSLPLQGRAAGCPCRAGQQAALAGQGGSLPLQGRAAGCPCRAGRQQPALAGQGGSLPWQGRAAAACPGRAAACPCRAERNTAAALAGQQQCFDDLCFCFQVPKKMRQVPTFATIGTENSHPEPAVRVHVHFVFMPWILFSSKLSGIFGIPTRLKHCERCRFFSVACRHFSTFLDKCRIVSRLSCWPFSPQTYNNIGRVHVT